MSALLTQCPCGTVQTWTGKVDPARTLKCTTTVRALYFTLQPRINDGYILGFLSENCLLSRKQRQLFSFIQSKIKKKSMVKNLKLFSAERLAQIVLKKTVKARINR